MNARVEGSRRSTPAPQGSAAGHCVETSNSPLRTKVLKASVGPAEASIPNFLHCSAAALAFSTDDE